jgi:hypothetical protein
MYNDDLCKYLNLQYAYVCIYIRMYVCMHMYVYTHKYIIPSPYERPCRVLVKFRPFRTILCQFPMGDPWKAFLTGHCRA